MRNLLTLSILLFNSIIYAQDWTTRTETPQNSFGYGLDETVDGFISIGTDSIFVDYTSKILVTRYSMCGDIIWENLIEPYGSFTAAGLSITSLIDGNYAGMGIMGTDSIYYFKMNPDGDLLWEKYLHSSYYLPGIRTIGQIEEDGTGNLYLMTEHNMIKFDASGDVIWNIDFLDEIDMRCKQFLIDPENNLFILGLNNTTLLKCDESGSFILTKNTYFNSYSIAHLGSQLVLGGNIGVDPALRFFDLEGDSILTHIVPYNEDDDWLTEYEDGITTNTLQLAVMTNGNLAMRVNYSGYYPFSWVKPYVIEYDYTSETIVHENFINDLSATSLFPSYSADLVGTFDDGYAIIGASYSVDEDDTQMTLWKFNDDCALAIASEDQTELNIYPNPSTDFIKISNMEEITGLYFYNIEGRQLNFPINIQHNEIDIRSLPKGIYILKIETSEGISAVKLVKS